MYWSPSPATIACDAIRIVISDEAQKRLTVQPGTWWSSPARVAPDVVALLADPGSGAHQHVDGLGEVDARVALDELSDRGRSELVRSDGLQRSLDRTTDRSADGVDDHGVRHGGGSSWRDV
jgi:hypothetical protein